jgi:hypothetical protein
MNPEGIETAFPAVKRLQNYASPLDPSATGISKVGPYCLRFEHFGTKALTTD